MLVTLKKILRDASHDGYAVGAFNVNNLEIVRAVIDTAVEEKSPVILQTSEGAIEYAGMEYLVAIINVAARAPVPVAMHLDHGKNLDTIRAALAAGYSSVMFDGSLLPYKENIATTKKVVGWAKKYHASVEAELGAIKGMEDLINVADKEAFFTDPEQAEYFVDHTHCDALAVSIGTAHGAHKFHGPPMLDIDRLQSIYEKIDVPLVLHGASGISPELVAKTRELCDQLDDCNRLDGANGVPDAMIRRAIAHGVRKINIDSDLRIAFTAGLRESIIRHHSEIDPRKLLTRPSQLMREVVRHKIELFGSRGRV